MQLYELRPPGRTVRYERGMSRDESTHDWELAKVATDRLLPQERQEIGMGVQDAG